MRERVTHGVVAAGDPETARAGAQLLAEGGNAIDAAVAAAFAAFVCELPLCSPLGGGVLLVHRAGDEPRALDMFARTPGLGAGPRGLVGAARSSRALDFDGVEVSFGAASQIFHVGRGSAAVPLALAGLLETHRRWGARPLADVVAPAVVLGRSGYVLGPGVAFVFGVLEPIVRRTAACFALFSDARGELARTGAQLRNPDLAATLEAIGARPDRAGDLLLDLARFLSPESGGLMTERDVADARPVEARPLRVRHRDWELSTMPGPSTGGVLVALGLRLLEGTASLAFLSKEHLLQVARVQEILLAERARTDRFDERCCDAAAVRALLDERRIAELRASVAEAAPDNHLGSTTHISVIDEHGSAVALTLTNGEGCGHVLPGTGMVINNLLGEEDLHPRGFHRDPAGSALATMMAPTVLARGDDHIALGSGGSNRLRTAILHVVAALIEHGVDPERAVRAPRLHLARAPAAANPSLAFELTGLDRDVAAELAAAYPTSPAIFDAPNLYFGGVHVATRVGGAFAGVGDERRGGAVVVV